MAVEPANCPKCKSRYNPTFEKCPFCATPRASSGSGLKAIPRTCPHCKRPINASFDTCPFCKKGVNEPVAAAAPAKPAPPRSQSFDDLEALTQKAAAAGLTRAARAAVEQVLHARTEPAPPAVDGPPLARDIAEAKLRLSTHGGLANFSSASVAAVDAYLTELLGGSPVTEVRRREFPDLDKIFGAYLGQLLVEKFGGTWQVDAAKLTQSRVTWPSGTSTSPFRYIQKRLERGSGQPVFGVFDEFRKGLVSHGDAKSLQEDSSAWFAQADRYALLSRRFDLAAQFVRFAISLGADTPANRVKLGTFLAQGGGSPDDALAEFEGALKSAPTSGEAWSGKAQVLAQRHQWPEALAAVNQALMMNSPQPAWFALKARIVRNLGLVDDALAAADESRRLDADAAEGWLESARALSMLGRLDEASRRLRRAVLLDPELVGGWVELGRVEERRERAHEAFKAYSRVKGHPRLSMEERVHADARLAVLGNDEHVLAETAAATHQRSGAADAVPEAQALVRKFPGSGRARRMLGALLLETGDAASALPELEKAIELLGDDGEAVSLKAHALFMLGKLPDALAFVTAALNRKPGDAKMLARQGALYVAQKKFPDALAALEAAVQADKEEAEGWRLKGDCEARMARTLEAVASYREYVERVPAWQSAEALRTRRALWDLEHPQSRVDMKQAAATAARAKDAMRAGRLSEAAGIYDEATRLDPFVGQVWFERGQCQSKLERSSEAVTSFHRAESLLGKRPDVIRERAQAQLQVGESQDALGAFDLLLELGDRTQDVWKGKLAALERLQRYEEALLVHERLVMTSGASPEALVGKADCLRALRRYDEALATYAQALAAAPGDEELVLKKSTLLSELGRTEEAYGS